MSTIVATSAAPAEPRSIVGAPAAPAGPPAIEGLGRLASDVSRTLFRHGNRWLMVPLHRAGLAPWLGNPITGWQLLLTTTGRRSGLPRPTPLGYVIADGSAWVMAGYGPSTLWLKNVRADPAVLVALPGRRPIAATAEVVDDALVRARIIPALVRSMPLPGCTIGTNVWTATDARLLDLVDWVPLVRLRPDGPELVPGADDPGGRGWVARQLLVLAAIVYLGRRSRRRRCRQRAVGTGDGTRPGPCRLATSAAVSARP
jgi:deazaflavin-dependent oxidoreductase (nitroreductase family)